MQMVQIEIVLHLCVASASIPIQGPLPYRSRMLPRDRPSMPSITSPAAPAWRRASVKRVAQRMEALTLALGPGSVKEPIGPALEVSGV